MITVLCVLNCVIITNSWFKNTSFEGKGKEIENKTNKHIRNKNTYNNKTTTITTENSNKYSFQKTYLIYRMITTTAVVKTTTIPKQRPMATGVLCLFSSLAWADSYRVGKQSLYLV